MAKNSELVRGSTIDESAARTAFDNLRAHFDALPLDQLQPIRVDIQTTAAMAHSIAVRDTAAERRAVFEQLGKAGVFDIKWWTHSRSCRSQPGTRANSSSSRRASLPAQRFR